MTSLWLHSHLRPWTDADCVVDAYRFNGKQVRAFGHDVMTVGRLVAIEDNRTATLLDADGNLFELRIHRLELAEDLA